MVRQGGYPGIVYSVRPLGRDRISISVSINQDLTIHYLVWPKGRRPPLAVRGPAVGLWYGQLVTIVQLVYKLLQKMKKWCGHEPCLSINYRGDTFRANKTQKRMRERSACT